MIFFLLRRNPGVAVQGTELNVLVVVVLVIVLIFAMFIGLAIYANIQ